MSGRTRRSDGDTFYLILNKLPQQFSSLIAEDTKRMVLIKAREKNRILDSKTTSGVALCPGDSQDLRSAVILESLLREGIEMKDGSKTASVRIPLEQFGKIVGKSVADTERVSNAVRNLLEKVSTNKISASSSSKSMISLHQFSSGKSLAELRAKPMQRPSRHFHVQDKQSLGNRKRTSTRSSSASHINPFPSQVEKIKGCDGEPAYDVQVKPKYLFDLSIRLQCKLFDPDSCHKMSSAVFEALVHKMIQEEGKNVSRRQAILDDLEMNAKQFEGACLFLVNRELDGGTIYDDYSRKKRKFMHENDEEEDSGLTIDDIANELRLETIGFENFVKGISDKILLLLKDIKSKPQQKEKKREKKEESFSSNMRNGMLNILNGHQGDDNHEEDLQHVVPQNCKARYINYDEYKKWKETILSKITIASESAVEATARVADEIASSILLDSGCIY